MAILQVRRAIFSLLSVGLFCSLLTGCSNSSSPNSNNNNNNGEPIVGVVGPTVGSTYLTVVSKADTNGTLYGASIYDTIVVVNNTLTYGGRTNVTQVQDNFYDPSLYPSKTTYTSNSYYGYDAAGDFYKYDTLYYGWRHYPVGSKIASMTHYDPNPLGNLSRDTMWGVTDSSFYTGTSSATISGVSVATANSLEYIQNYLELNHKIGLKYYPAIKFYAVMVDTLTNVSQVGNGAVNPIIYRTALLTYTLK
jgi:hypothetical protein